MINNTFVIIFIILPIDLPISKVSDRHHSSYSAAQWDRLRSGYKPFVERTAFVGFHMGKPNISKPLDRNNALHCFTH